MLNGNGGLLKTLTGGAAPLAGDEEADQCIPWALIFTHLKLSAAADGHLRLVTPRAAQLERKSFQLEQDQSSRAGLSPASKPGEPHLHDSLQRLPVDAALASDLEEPALGWRSLLAQLAQLLAC